jgi:hypothetical protein
VKVTPWRVVAIEPAVVEIVTEFGDAAAGELALFKAAFRALIFSSRLRDSGDVCEYTTADITAIKISV